MGMCTVAFGKVSTFIILIFFSLLTGLPSPQWSVKLVFCWCCVVGERLLVNKDALFLDFKNCVSLFTFCFGVLSALYLKKKLKVNVPAQLERCRAVL